MVLQQHTNTRITHRNNNSLNSSNNRNRCRSHHKAFRQYQGVLQDTIPARTDRLSHPRATHSRTTQDPPTVSRTPHFHREEAARPRSTMLDTGPQVAPTLEPTLAHHTAAPRSTLPQALLPDRRHIKPRAVRRTPMLSLVMRRRRVSRKQPPHNRSQDIPKQNMAVISYFTYGLFIFCMALLCIKNLNQYIYTSVVTICSLIKY